MGQKREKGGGGLENGISLNRDFLFPSLLK